MDMTSRERVEAALAHREPDRTPVFEYVLLSPVADQLLGWPYAADPANWQAMADGKGWEGAVRQAAADRLDLACLLGHDMMYVTPNPPPGQVSAPAQPSSQEADGDPVQNVRRRNEVAAQSPPGPRDDSFMIYVYLKDAMERRDMDLPILAPAYSHGVWTDVDLMQTMLLAPEVAHEHFSLATRRAMAIIEKYVSLGIEQIGIGGDFSGTRPLISPRSYREFIVPELRTLARNIHAAGRWAVNTSDGDLWPVIDDFLLGCEVDGYLEIDVFAGMDLRRLKAAYGDRITFYGNIDCGNLLSFGSSEQVKRHTMDCLRQGWGNGGHILCAGNAITESVPLRNYLAVVAGYREAFGLPEFRLRDRTTG